MSSLKTGCIYIHTNIISGKSYIGLTTRSMETRLKQHISDALNGSPLHFHKALNKYPKDSWVSKVLEDTIPLQRLALTEKYYISKYDTFTNGYNLTKGGDSYDYIGMVTKLRQANLGKKQSTETVNKRRDKLSSTNSSSFKPWWYMTPTGEFIEVNDMTQNEFAMVNGISLKAISNMNHEKVIEQGPMKGWCFGKGTLDKLEWYSNITKPKRKSPTTKGQPRDTSFNNKQVNQYDKVTGALIATYTSAKDAGAALGLSNSGQIVRSARGERRVGSGYIWKYVCDITNDWTPPVDSVSNNVRNKRYNKLTLNGEFIERYETMNELLTANPGTKQVSISKYIRDKRDNGYKGFHWEQA